jgi:hypothetical protein
VGVVKTSTGTEMNTSMGAESPDRQPVSPLNYLVYEKLEKRAKINSLAHRSRPSEDSNHMASLSEVNKKTLIPSSHHYIH